MPMNKFEEIKGIANEFLSRDFSLDLTAPKSIIILIIALLVGISLTVLFVVFTLKGQKIAKANGVPLFNIIHIVLFAMPVITIMFVRYFQTNLILWCVISIIAWIIPIVINIVTIGKYAPMFIFLQIIFAILVCTVVGAIIAVIVMGLLLLLAGSVWADDYIDFYMYDSYGGIVGVKKVSKNSFVDTKGNHYTYTGYNGEYIDTYGNIYRVKNK